LSELQEFSSSVFHPLGTSTDSTPLRGKTLLH